MALHSSHTLRAARSVSGVLLLAAMTGGFWPQAASGADRNRIAVTAVRYWSLGEVTRIAIQTTGEFTYKYRRLSNPERIYFDVLDSTHRVSEETTHMILVDDGLVKRIRVAQNRRSVTRVVLDLEGKLKVTSSQLANPDRLMLEIRRQPRRRNPRPKSRRQGRRNLPR